MRRRKQVVGSGSEVAVAAVGGAEGSIGGAGDFLDGAGKDGAAGVELAGVGFGEGLAGEIEAEAAGFGGAALFAGIDRLREGRGNGGALFELGGLAGELVGEAGDVGEQDHGGAALPFPSMAHGKKVARHYPQDRFMSSKEESTAKESFPCTVGANRETCLAGAVSELLHFEERDAWARCTRF